MATSPIRSDDDGIARFEALRTHVAADAARFRDAAALARKAGLSAGPLADFFQVHAHLTPAAWLRRQRVDQAARALLVSRDKADEIGLAAGFETRAGFDRHFLAHTRMRPEAYRALDATGFLLQLPAGYRAREVLAYHARDPEGLNERSEGNRIWKALITPDGPAVLEIALNGTKAHAKVHARRTLGRDAMAFLHRASLRMLGLDNEVAPFETRHAAFAAPRLGLRLPGLPTGFDALAWGIIGQQIHVKFAVSLRRELIGIAGEPIERMRAHPTPEDVANIAVPTLHARRYSRAKARYLIDAAAAVVCGDLDIEAPHHGSAVAAERSLTAQRGIGLWTARYVMLRAGFADAAPIGDSALATALQKLHRLSARPGAEEAARLMTAFAPYRSLATMHLWTYLKEAA